MKFDVVIIGGGHAGIEAAHASAKLGCRTALFSLDVSRIGVMSCNPAIGGLAKGQLVKEIDALGGVMGINTDKTAIQYRRLNESKGPAVRSSRAQCDKNLYAQAAQRFLKTVENLTVLESEISKIIVDGSQVAGVETTTGERITCRAAVITAGTFLKGVMYTGLIKEEGGRSGDRAANGLSSSLESLGFKLGRLKTGTPPRLDKNSIDYSKLLPQPGDLKPLPFSFYFKPERFPMLPQVDCHITYTNEVTHRIIEENFDKSPMYTGLIQGVGPRYCPSIEDKVKRFRTRERHQIFLEPEGLEVREVYVNGVSTSLPREAQDKFIHSIEGLENAKFIRYGYAVEYDCVDARKLRQTFESKDVPGLFFAGQINGTSGYEEAAAQGLVAGLNAAHLIKEREPFIIGRADGYIGVMVDDLVTKGADEPYRMFTSRAEHRLLLREDNADLRLSEMGYRLGLLPEHHYKVFCSKRDEIGKARAALSSHFFLPTVEVNERFAEYGMSGLKDRISAEVLLKRPEVNWSSLCKFGFPGSDTADEVSEQAEIQVKYEGYIRRELELLEGMSKYENFKIPIDLDFEKVAGLSSEIRGRLKNDRPETIGQVSRMRGVTPAAVASLLIFLKMKTEKGRNRHE